MDGIKSSEAFYILWMSKVTLLNNWNGTRNYGGCMLKL